jgi:hypothetical protein
MDSDATRVASRNPVTLADADRTRVTEQSDVTRIRNDGATDASQVESIAAPFQEFMGYSIAERLKTSGQEADIFRLKGKDLNDDRDYILKLYHFNSSPKKEILDKIYEFSKQFPEHVVKIEDYGQASDPGQWYNERWYEIQEYARYGSLRNLMEEFREESRDPARLREIIREITETLRILHQKDVVHCDLKPANILVRSRNPLDLILTDFGISSILDPEASLRATSRKGTPLYQAPETFSGHVGRASDWWALGCIVCEILLSKHPFSGLSESAVMLRLIQKGIELNEGDFTPSVWRDYALLLKGLLTPDYQKRWGGEEVLRWLNGDHGIPVYYGQGSETKSYNPYRVDEAEYYTIYEITAAFAVDEKSWGQGLKDFYRGDLEKWLARNGQGEEKRKVADIKDVCIDQEDRKDEGLFELIYTYNPLLPFSFLGKRITLENLYRFCGKMRKKEASQTESNLLRMVWDGSLSVLYETYLQQTSSKRDDGLRTILHLLKKHKPEQQWHCLRALYVPQEYLWPLSHGDIIAATLQDRIRFLEQSGISYLCPLRALKNAVLTAEMIQKMQNAAHYNEFLRDLERSSSGKEQRNGYSQEAWIHNCDGSVVIISQAAERFQTPPPVQARPPIINNTEIIPDTPPYDYDAGQSKQQVDERSYGRSMNSEKKQTAYSDNILIRFFLGIVRFCIGFIGAAFFFFSVSLLGLSDSFGSIIAFLAGVACVCINRETFRTVAYYLRWCFLGFWVGAIIGGVAGGSENGMQVGAIVGEIAFGVYAHHRRSRQING